MLYCSFNHSLPESSEVLGIPELCLGGTREGNVDVVPLALSHPLAGGVAGTREECPVVMAMDVHYQHLGIVVEGLLQPTTVVQILEYGKMVVKTSSQTS